MHYLDYREDRVHGTADFPFAFYHIEEGHPRYEMPFHWHREVEIIRILAGTFSCCLDDETILLKTGDILFVNPGVIHSGTPSSCVYECAVFDPSALLMQAAENLQDPELPALLRKKLGQGMTYAAARALAAEERSPGMGALLRTPNNILGIEYCKAIQQQGAALQPLALPRWGAAHGGAAGEHGGVPMASASYLRERPPEAWAPYVPGYAMELYRAAAAEGQLLEPRRLESALLALLRARDPGAFAQVRGVSEGLENRLAAAVRAAGGLEDLYARLKTKRYPHARLRRLALDAALGIPQELPPPPWLLVLGARKSALPRLKNTALPAGTSLADLARAGAQARQAAELHSRCVDFSSLCREKICPMGLAFTTKPVIV